MPYSQPDTEEKLSHGIDHGLSPTDLLKGKTIDHIDHNPQWGNAQIYFTDGTWMFFMAEFKADSLEEKLSRYQKEIQFLGG